MHFYFEQNHTNIAITYTYNLGTLGNSSRSHRKANLPYKYEKKKM